MIHSSLGFPGRRRGAVVRLLAFSIMAFASVSALAACPPPETCPGAGFVRVGNTWHCGDRPDILPDEFDDPKGMCHGVSNPNMAKIRADYARMLQWKRANPGCYCGFVGGYAAWGS